MQGHPVRRDDQSHGESGPAFFVRSDRPESGVASHPGPDDPAGRERPDQGARLVQGCAASDRPRAAIPARERIQGRRVEGVLGRLRIRRGRERLRRAPTPDLLTHLHDLRLRERVHRTRDEDRESGGGEGEDRFPPRPEHEAGETVRKAPGSPDREGFRGHRTGPREGGPRGGRHLPERPRRESRDQGIRRCIRTRARGLAMVSGRLRPWVLQRSRRRALHLRTRGLVRRFELSRAERALPHGGFRRRLETHGRDVCAHVSRPPVRTRSSGFLAYLYLEVRMRRSTHRERWPQPGPHHVPKLLRPKGGSPRPMDTDVNLCKVDDVLDGGKKHFEIMGYDILVVRLGDRFFCVDAACTYKWAMLTDGLVDREKLLITCKDCNGSWDLQTGQPKELPAKFPLTAYRIESVADDLIVTFTY